MPVELSQKVKFFRKKRDKSQTELELLIDASPGSMSRIESGNTKPTMDTLKKISQVLELNFIEEEYFFKDNYFTDPTEVELNKAYEECRSILEDTSCIAYILDKKHRAWFASAGMLKVLKLTQKEFDTNFKGINLFEAISDPDLPVWKIVDHDNYSKVLEIQIARLFAEFPFWEIEDYWVSLFKNLCQRFEHFQVAFDNAVKNLQNIDLLSNEARTVTFKISGLKFKLTHSQERLNSASKFDLIIYTPENKFVSFLQKYFL